jgi:hypothetical protein
MCHLINRTAQPIFSRSNRLIGLLHATTAPRTTIVVTIFEICT